MFSLSEDFKNKSIQVKLGSILSLFVVLTFLNCAAVKYFQNKQEADTHVVDIAGRNRMLVQRVGFLAQRIIRGQEDERPALREAIDLHDFSLKALKIGGVAPGFSNNQLLPPTDPQVIPTLLSAEKLWVPYKQRAETILKLPLHVDTVQSVGVLDSAGNMVQQAYPTQIVNPEVSAALAFIEKNAMDMLTRNNTLVKRYVLDSKRKQWASDAVLITVLLLNGLLVVIALYIVKKAVTNPAKIIKETTHRLAQGDLSKVKGYKSQDEIGQAVHNINAMVRHLAEAVTFAKQIGQGNYDKSIEVASDKDSLGQALLEMREQLQKAKEEDQKRNWMSDGLAKFSDLIMNSHDNLEELAHHTLSALIKHIEANQGALFIVNDENPEAPYLELVFTYAWGRKKYVQAKVEPGEDILGQAWLEQEIVYLEEIPSNYAKVRSGTGETDPSSILIVPAKVNDEVVAMLEIASLKVYTDYQQEFIQKVVERMASVIASLMVRQRTEVLLAKAQEQSEEMRTQEEAMRLSMEELEATQEEMARKEKEYQKTIAALKAGETNT
ncbi:GAF domain-containing protein [Tunicatimonas pelagia]|uniref:GAF domain-containing protein n=1 Tax=Tunicatimonas pelagia TaxID=931531 RepID=UPI0026666658|nr:GAF domain-containing protein [Tunicatimonas pelagia]WKN44004.1 type IV pili methyl-accepting chemotaxis transducer N-terminal domain-containing protein [Tunicatimonas pelagia]